jgi:hypothetical protein
MELRAVENCGSFIDKTLKIEIDGRFYYNFHDKVERNSVEEISAWYPTLLTPDSLSYVLLISSLILSHLFAFDTDLSNSY